ncbi:MAG: hypothetical protein Q9179_007828 [Wetmoreana sp. 5 TL-2023]
MSHRRTSIVTATTTISQTFEPSPPNPATLSRSLSSSSTDKPLDRAAALAELGPPPHARGLLLLAEMSSEGNLMGQGYTEKCIEAARNDKDFVLGFVAQRNLNKREMGDEFLVFVPGVALPPEEEEVERGGVKGDGKGQRWRGPYEVMQEGADVVIVGRGILNARDKAAEAERYRKEAWRGYQDLLGANKEKGKGKGKR